NFSGPWEQHFGFTSVTCGETAEPHSCLFASERNARGIAIVAGAAQSTARELVMSNTGILSAYRQNAIQGASPVGLVVALYDAVLRDFRLAMEAMDRGDVELRVHELNHALTVIAHLKSVLNHQSGGEAAARFDNFYEVARGMILKANVNSS